MDSVQIILDKHNFCKTFTKSILVERFPDSLFGLALSQDPSATEIVIKEPIVTPIILEFIGMIYNNEHPLVWMMNQDTTMTQEELHRSLIGSSRYLLIPELTLFTSKVCVSFATAGWLNPKDINERYEQFLTAAAVTNYVEYTEYLLDYYPGTPEVHNKVFFQAVIDDKLWVVQMLIRKKKVDPVTAEFDPSVIDSSPHRVKFFEIFGGSHSPTGKSSPCLYYAVGMWYFDMVKWLLSHTGVIDDGYCLHLADTAGCAGGTYGKGMGIVLMTHYQYSREVLVGEWGLHNVYPSGYGSDSDDEEDGKENDDMSMPILSTILLTQGEVGSDVVVNILRGYNRFTKRYKQRLLENPRSIIPETLLDRYTPDLLNKF